MLYDILSYIGGYLNSNSFELDISKIADVSEIEEAEVLKELDILQSNGDIELKNDKITLVTIPLTINKNFNELWTPIEEFIWKPNMIIKLDV